MIINNNLKTLQNHYIFCFEIFCYFGKDTPKLKILSIFFFCCFFPHFPHQRRGKGVKIKVEEKENLKKKTGFKSLTLKIFVREEKITLNFNKFSLQHVKIVKMFKMYYKIYQSSMSKNPNTERLNCLTKTMSC